MTQPHKPIKNSVTFTQSEHSFDFKGNVFLSAIPEYSEKEEDLESKTAGVTGQMWYKQFFLEEATIHRQQDYLKLSEG